MISAAKKDNLVEMSKIKSDSMFSVINGIDVPRYEFVIVHIDMDDKSHRCYIVHRTNNLIKDYSWHTITCHYKSDAEERAGVRGNKKTKFYNTTKDFENALKRIQKLNDNK